MKRTLVMWIVLVLVLGGGLVALQLAGERPVRHAPATATQVPAPTPPPAIPSRSRTPAPAGEQDSGTLTGRVIDGMTHEGIANAELTFVGDGGVSMFRTSSDGGFEITPAATGSATLAAITAPGFLPYAPEVGSSARVTLARGQAVHDITLRLYRAVDYEGTVVDAHGAPVPAVTVRLVSRPGEQALESPPEWTTGRDGRFTFQAADGAVLEARRGAVRGWAHVDRNVVILKKLTIWLGYPPPRDATITGRVRDSGGAPLADAVIRATPSEYYTSASTVVATSGSDGSFTLAGVERTAYDLSADAADHLQATRATVHGGSRNVELTLDAGLPLAGQVVDPHGEPVASFTLIVQRRIGLAREPVSTLSLIDPQGRFAVRVARGDYDLIAVAPDQPQTAVEAVAGATDVRIVIGSGTTLRGKVISSDDGAPIAEAFVGLEAARRGGTSGSVVPVTATRGDGTFELAGLTSGPLRIEVRARGHAAKVEELPPAATAGLRDPVTIELASAPDPVGGGAISGIGVQVVPDGDALRVAFVLPASGALDAGVKDGDLIVAVDDVAIASVGVETALARIRGPAGTTVNVTLRRNGRDIRLSIERRQLRA